MNCHLYLNIYAENDVHCAVFYLDSREGPNSLYIFSARAQLGKVNWDSVQMAGEKRVKPDMACHLPRRYAHVCK